MTFQHKECVLSPPERYNLTLPAYTGVGFCTLCHVPRGTFAANDALFTFLILLEPEEEATMPPVTTRGLLALGMSPTWQLQH